MIKILGHWLAALNDAERDLRSQGYVVVCGGITSFVVPMGYNKEPPRQSHRPMWVGSVANSKYRRFQRHFGIQVAALSR
jgi:hypothetical protein